MGFLQQAAEQAFQESMQRVRAGIDHGSVDQMPGFDAKAELDLLKQQTDNRTDEPFRQALEYHGFVWWPLAKIRRARGGRTKTEGEWRSDRLRLAYTATDLPRSFRTPEEFDREIRDIIAARKVSAGRLPKAELRRMRSRR